MKKNKRLVSDIEAFYTEWIEPLATKPKRTLQVFRAISSAMDDLQFVGNAAGAASSAASRELKPKCIPSSDPDY
jgi:hypothetical protein